MIAKTCTVNHVRLHKPNGRELLKRSEVQSSFICHFAWWTTIRCYPTFATPHPKRPYAVLSHSIFPGHGCTFSSIDYEVSASTALIYEICI